MQLKGSRVPEGIPVLSRHSISVNLDYSLQNIIGKHFDSNNYMSFCKLFFCISLLKEIAIYLLIKFFKGIQTFYNKISNYFITQLFFVLKIFANYFNKRQKSIQFIWYSLKDSQRIGGKQQFFVTFNDIWIKSNVIYVTDYGFE